MPALPLGGGAAKFEPLFGLRQIVLGFQAKQTVGEIPGNYGWQTRAQIVQHNNSGFGLRYQDHHRSEAGDGAAVLQDGMSAVMLRRPAKRVSAVSGSCHGDGPVELLHLSSRDELTAVGLAVVQMKLQIFE